MKRKTTMFSILVMVLLGLLAISNGGGAPADAGGELPVPQVLSVHQEREENQWIIDVQYVNNRFFLRADPTWAPQPQFVLYVDDWSRSPAHWILKWWKYYDGVWAYYDLGQVTRRDALGPNDQQGFATHEAVMGRKIVRQDGLVAYECFARDMSYGGTVYGPYGGVNPATDQTLYRPYCNFLPEPGVSNPPVPTPTPTPSYPPPQGPVAWPTNQSEAASTFGGPWYRWESNGQGGWHLRDGGTVTIYPRGFLGEGYNGGDCFSFTVPVVIQGGTLWNEAGTQQAAENLRRRMHGYCRVIT